MQHLGLGRPSKTCMGGDPNHRNIVTPDVRKCIPDSHPHFGIWARRATAGFGSLQEPISNSVTVSDDDESSEGTAETHVEHPNLGKTYWRGLTAGTADPQRRRRRTSPFPSSLPHPPPFPQTCARKIVLRCRKRQCVCKMQRHVLRILPWGPFYGIYRGSLCKLSKSQPGSSPSTEGPCVEGARRPAPEATPLSHLQGRSVKAANGEFTRRGVGGAPPYPPWRGMESKERGFPSIPLRR